jgi:hypothetical protein
MHLEVWWGSLRGRGLVRDESIDGRETLRWSLRKWGAKMGDR